MSASPSQPRFEEDLTSAFCRLRGALAEVVAASGGSTSAPQDIARRLGISRNLTWKISKVVGIPDLYQALQHLPGAEGIEILLKASERAGVAAGLLALVRDAQDEFDRVVEIHTGDRATLEMILDSMGGESHERLEQSRKLAFRGNSAIWGVQARVRSTTYFMAPNERNPARLDSAVIGGLIDFRRLRSNVRWPLFRPNYYGDDGEPLPFPPEEDAIDPEFGASDGPRLIGAFCSPRRLPIRAVRNRRGWVYELQDGPIGNTGACTCFFGALLRDAASRYRTEADKSGEFESQITLPVETVQVDLFIHRDLEFAMRPEVLVRGELDSAADLRDAVVLPVSERTRRLSGHPPVISTPLFPRYESLITLVVDRAGWSLRDFEVIRLTMQYPPMHSGIVLRFPLPEHP